MNAPGIQIDEKDTQHLLVEEPRSVAPEVGKAQQARREQQPACPTCGLPAPPEHDCLADLVTHVNHQAEKLKGYAEGVLEKCAYCSARLTGEEGQWRCSRCFKRVCKVCEYDGIRSCLICS